MASIKIGRVRLTDEGAFNPTKAYDTLSIVTHNNVTYWSIRAVPLGNYPDAFQSPYWKTLVNKGEKGDPGPSLYALAVTDGFTGTLSEYLESIKGASAYAIAVKQGFTGTVNEWLASLRGAHGPSAYEIWLSAGNTGTVNDFIASLKGKDGYTVPISDTLISPDSGVAASSKAAYDLNQKVTTVTTDINNVKTDLTNIDPKIQAALNARVDNVAPNTLGIANSGTSTQFARRDHVHTAQTTITGNAGSATKLASPKAIGGVPFDGTSNIDLPGVNKTGNQSTTGNAATATQLETARKIGGVNFDGTNDITLPGVNAVGNQNTTGTASAWTTARSLSIRVGAAAYTTVSLKGDTDITANLTGYYCTWCQYCTAFCTYCNYCSSNCSSGGNCGS